MPGLKFKSPQLFTHYLPKDEKLTLDMPSFLSSTPAASQQRPPRTHSSDPPRLFPPPLLLSSSRRRLSPSPFGASSRDPASTATVLSDDLEKLRDLCRRAGANVTLAITDEDEREQERHLNDALDVLRRMERILGLYAGSESASDGAGLASGMGGGGVDGVQDGTEARSDATDGVGGSGSEASAEEGSEEPKEGRGEGAAETDGVDSKTPAVTAKEEELRAASESEELSRRRREEVQQFAARMRQLEDEAQRLDAALGIGNKARHGSCRI